MNEITTNKLDWKAMPVKGFEGKPLLDHMSGSIKMVKIEPGCEYPIHQHPDKTEFAFVLEGTLEATIGENSYIGESGAFYQFPFGVKHALKNPADTDTVVLVGAFKEGK